jgi:hypothetical protein
MSPIPIGDAVGGYIKAATQPAEDPSLNAYEMPSAAPARRRSLSRRITEESEGDRGREDEGDGGGRSSGSEEEDVGRTGPTSVVVNPEL